MDTTATCGFFGCLIEVSVQWILAAMTAGTAWFFVALPAEPAFRPEPQPDSPKLTIVAR